MRNGEGWGGMEGEGTREQEGRTAQQEGRNEVHFPQLEYASMLRRCIMFIILALHYNMYLAFAVVATFILIFLPVNVMFGLF